MRVPRELAAHHNSPVWKHKRPTEVSHVRLRRRLRVQCAPRAASRAREPHSAQFSAPSHETSSSTPHICARFCSSTQFSNFHWCTESGPWSLQQPPCEPLASQTTTASRAQSGSVHVKAQSGLLHERAGAPVRHVSVVVFAFKLSWCAVKNCMDSWAIF